MESLANTAGETISDANMQKIRDLKVDF